VIAEAVLPLTGARVLAAWRSAPLVDGALGALAAAYLAGALRARRQHRRRPWTVARTLAFLLGLAVIGVAVQGSAGVYDDALFSMHMVQHVLLIMVAPPLLVWGRPITLLMHAVGNPVHSWVKRIVRSPVVAALTWPPAATVGYAVVVAGTHTPAVMDFVLRNEAAHDGEHALYLVSGYLFFLLIVGSEPIRWRIPMVARYAMLLVAMQVDTVIGVVFMVAGHELFPGYSHSPWPSGPDPLSDLRLGGMVMWMGSDIVMVVIALILAVGIVRLPGIARDATWAAGAGRGVPGRLMAGARTVPAQPAGDGDGDLAAYNSYLAALDTGDRPAAGGNRARPGITGRLGSVAAAPLGDLVRDAEGQRGQCERRERPVIGEGQANDQDGARIQGHAVAVGQVAPPGPESPALPEPDRHGDELDQYDG
jgi:putative copper resistance protein D